MTPLVRLLAVGLAALTLAGSAAAARVPLGVSSIRIRSATGITTTVIGRPAIREIVKRFDALPRFVARPCPYQRYTPPDVSFDFRALGHGVVLHAVDHFPGTCRGSITYSTKGQLKHAALADRNFVAQVSNWVGDIDPNPRTAGNELLARRDAARLVRLAVLPPGSRLMTWTPKAFAATGQPPSTTSPHNDRIWKVRMSLDAVLAFERAHRPDGSKMTNSGKSYSRAHGPSSPLMVEGHVTFSFPAIRHRVWTRELGVGIVPLANGWTAIRIGAWDDWVLAHDPDEVVPSGVRTIEIRKGSLLAHRVTTPHTIATIIRWFDALPVAPPAGPCGPLGALPGHHLRFERITFLGGSGQVLARAKDWPYGIPSGACNPIAFSAGGHSFPPLLGGRFLIRVERLLR